ncbi:MAG: hypothetical protein OXH05_03330 [Acidobacteria bacterium]|nr:hypothetical protein [Acidobacteriota bacterium]MYA45828.1 hypothetical protein [Acidobacteriota bacterium]MYK78650.1 hypothetical protein [Acidobacteriota bacterium]
MKRITLSVDEESYQSARTIAAAAGISVSALVRECLKVIAQTETDEDREERFRRLRDDVYAAIRKRESEVTAGRLLTRDELHDRDARRREHEEAMRRDARPIRKPQTHGATRVPSSAPCG